MNGRAVVASIMFDGGANRGREWDGHHLEDGEQHQTPDDGHPVHGMHRPGTLSSMEFGILPTARGFNTYLAPASTRIIVAAHRRDRLGACEFDDNDASMDRAIYTGLAGFHAGSATP